MDYRVYHSINLFVYQHAWLGRGPSLLEIWAVPVIAIATFALWLLARPGGSRKWKLASASALGSAALALLVNQLDWKGLAPRTALRLAPIRSCLGQSLPRSLLPERPRQRGLRDRIRRPSLRPRRRRLLPRSRIHHRCRPRLHRSPLPIRRARRLPRRSRLCARSCTSGRTVDQVARPARRARDRSAARAHLALTRSALGRDRVLYSFD